MRILRFIAGYLPIFLHISKVQRGSKIQPDDVAEVCPELRVE